MGRREVKIMDTVDKIDNKVDLTYVAERLMRITEISDRRKRINIINPKKIISINLSIISNINILPTYLK